MDNPAFDTKYQAQPSDIAILSYPRTGTTWLRAMIAHMFIGADASPKQVCDRIAWLESHRCVHNQPNPLMWSSHACLGLCPWNDLTRYIVIARNPKDTCVSFYYHAIKTELTPEDTTFGQFFEMFINGKIPDGHDGFYKSYFDYYLDWWRYAQDKTNMMFVTYEDLKFNQEQNLLEMSRFIGNGREETLLADDSRLLKGIVKATGFEKMKPEIDGIGHGFFARKGIVGDYKNYLNDDMERRLDKMFHDTFDGTGFEHLWDRYGIF